MTCAVETGHLWTVTMFLKGWMDYHPSVMYNHLLVNDKHKVRDCSQDSLSTMTLTYKCQIYSVKDIFNLNLFFKYVLMGRNIFPMLF